MFGASSNTPPAPRGWDPSFGADHAPTLAPPPEGLSARRVERWLDLPIGAWQRRHLYALRLTGQAYASLGFCPGDLVVVEPGVTDQPGRIVLTRSRTGQFIKRISTPAKRLEAPTSTDWRMPTVLELPLRERTVPRGEHVVGTIIGLLRATGTGALRPVPLLSLRSGSKRRRTPAARPAAMPTVRSSCPPPVFSEPLVEAQSEWRLWVDASRRSPAGVTPAEAERWARLDASLATLCDCLAHTHSPSLRAALSAEAGAVVAKIRTEMCG